MPPMEIELSTVEEGVNRYTFRTTPEELELEEEGAVYRRNVDVRVKITRTGSTLTLDGSAGTRVERSCARCLRTFEEDVGTEFFEAIRIEGEMAQVLDDQYDGDPGFLSPAPGTITIDPLVRESVLVLSPIKPVCRPECKGLCPVCGADRNEKDCDCQGPGGHSAWKTLRDLTQDLEKRE